ncbi:MAG: DEAD/DEAH box helicase [Desulfobacteraceae bacterium]
MKFEKYHISQEIKDNLSRQGFKKPTDIQFKAIPSIMKGEDVLAVAQTGTGKTAAFAIPVIDRIHKKKSSRRSRGIQCIVMVPTRELAQQIGEVFTWLGDHTRVKTFSLFGGVEQNFQIKKLQHGIDVLITTPGRMFDLINQGHIQLESVETLILDEADRMLDPNFIRDIKFVKSMLVQKHQTLFFSATIGKEIKKLAFSQVKSSAIRIQLSPKDPVSKNVSHFVMFVNMDDKRFFLERFINDHPESRIIVFVRTRVRAERVAKAMERVGIAAMTIHGEKEQEERSAAMKAFRQGQCNILIATDISARGIDIPGVDYVVNYDLPEIAENYVHRVGRTGRAFNKGDAVSFCGENEKELLEAVQQLLEKNIDVIPLHKKEYARTIELPEETSSLDALLDAHGLDGEKKGEKKGKKKNRRKK